ncbi:hypothetical protein [Haloarcula laminariae]|uniref:hypothetical protein n=1 Tax=Haloarcula laminariae TaxID=2961577 RepID=UPI00240667EE|nr:hypothetical protein [Halomicroarcula sp. FL173]
MSDRRLLVAGALAALAVTAAYSVVYTGVASFGPSEFVVPGEGGAAGVALAVLGTWVTGALWYVPYLAVVLRFVAEPSGESALSGAIIIYAAGLLFAWVPTRVLGTEATLATAVVPLGDVAAYLAVVAAVWLAYNGSAERVVEGVSHPVAAIGSDARLTPDLPLQRGLFAATAAAALGTGGRVLTGVLHEQVRAAATTGFGVSFTTGVGVPPERVPVELAFEAAFLLGVLLVTGPRLKWRTVLKAVGVVVGVQVTAALLNALFVDTELVASGLLLRPVAGAGTLLAVAAAVWLAFHDGLERVGL